MIWFVSMAMASELVSPSVGKMVWIPPGTFWMGSPTTEKLRQDDETRRKVVVEAGFWMMEHEVTQAQYAALAGTNPSTGRTLWNGHSASSCAAVHKGETLVAPDYPVTCVTWLDAVSFANTLSEKEGLKPAYQVAGAVVTPLEDTDGYRLPTEVQWEYAGRGGAEGMFGSSDSVETVCDVGNILDLSAAEKYGWSTTKGTICRDLHTALGPVGSYEPNGFGLYDMVGNVSEWTSDTHPGNAIMKNARVIRGGSWRSHSNWARLAVRPGYPADAREKDLGFRLVRPGNRGSQ